MCDKEKEGDSARVVCCLMCVPSSPPFPFLPQGLGGTSKAASDTSNYMVFNGDVSAHHRSDDGVLPAFKRLKYETS